MSELKNINDDNNDKEFIDEFIFHTIQCSAEEGDSVTVRCQGDPKLPTIMTYHDFGLDYTCCFGSFFNHPKLSEVFKHFHVIHITGSGQQPNAATLPATFQFSIEKLISQVDAVRAHFEIEKFFALGVGLGAVIFLNYGISHSQHVLGQILISPTGKPTGWLEYVYGKVGCFAMSMVGMGSGSLVHSQLLARYFSAEDALREPDAYAQCADALTRVNAANLARLVDGYAWRTGVAEDALATIGVRSVVVTQKWGYYDDDALELNGALPFDSTVYIRLDESSHLALNCADQLAAPLLLFFQGFGYCLEQQLNPSIREQTEKRRDDQDSIARFNAKWASKWEESDSDEDDDE